MIQGIKIEDALQCQSQTSECQTSNFRIGTHMKSRLIIYVYPHCLCVHANVIILYYRCAGKVLYFGFERRAAGTQYHRLYYVYDTETLNGMYGMSLQVPIPTKAHTTACKCLYKARRGAIAARRYEIIQSPRSVVLKQWSSEVYPTPSCLLKARRYQVGHVESLNFLFPHYLTMRKNIPSCC